MPMTGNKEAGVCLKYLYCVALCFAKHIGSVDKIGRVFVIIPF